MIHFHIVSEWSLLECCVVFLRLCRISYLPVQTHNIYAFWLPSLSSLYLFIIYIDWFCCLVLYSTTYLVAVTIPTRTIPKIEFLSVVFVKLIL